MSFLRSEAKSRVGKENKLVQLGKIINWEQIGRKLRKIHVREINGKGGNKPYDSLKMFKAVLLGQWHSLSDPGLEEALKLRLDFMIFTGLEGEVPDETTICRFRNKLVEMRIYEELLEEINEQLSETGLKVKECEGAVIDATIIESASRPKTTIEEIAQDRKEEETGTEEEKQVQLNYAKDSEARWLKKGRRSYFGYKGYIAADTKDGYIEKVHITAANRSEVKELENTLPDKKIKRVYADKGYSSKENREKLKGLKIRDGIMSKAQRGKGLSHWEKVRNKLISKKRFIVEQGFGTLKRRFEFKRAWYLTKAKVLAQFICKAICFNLLKAVNKVVWA